MKVDKSVSTKIMDLCEKIKKVADECIWSSNCTMVTNKLADKLKLTNSVYKLADK